MKVKAKISYYDIMDDDWDWYCYVGDWDYWDSDNVEYDYLPDTVGDWVRKIDMSSIDYSTDILRDRKLNSLFGDINEYKQTLGDFWKHDDS